MDDKFLKELEKFYIELDTSYCMDCPCQNECLRITNITTNSLCFLLQTIVETFDKEE